MIDEACFVEPINSEQDESTSYYQQVKNSKKEEQANILSFYTLNSSLNSTQSIISPLTHSPKFDFLRSLPIELATYILLSIGDCPQTLLNCKLVSKYWYQCVQDPIVWREIFINHPHWKVKHPYTKFKQEKSNHIKLPSNLNYLPSSYLPRQNSIQSNESFKKLLFHNSTQSSSRSDSVSSSSTANTSQINSSNQNLNQNHNSLLDMEPSISLDWLKLYRDRYILDKRWSDGKQMTKSLKGHKDSIYCVQLNGNQIITGSRDRTIKIWDMKTGTCTDSLTGHKGSVLCARCDGSTMLTGSSDCQVFVWEEVEESPTRKRWQIKQKLIGHQSGVLDLGLDENLIVSCSKDTTTKIWNRQDGSLIRTLTGHTGPVNALELCRNPLKWIEKPTDNTTPSFNDDTNITTGLLTASGDSTMKLWELQTGRLVRTFEGHIRGLACLKLVEDNHLVVTGSNDETIKFWNLITGQCFRTLLGHSGLVRSLDIDLSQNRLVSGSYDKTIKVWDLKTGEVKLDFRKGEKRLVFDAKVHLTSIVLVGHDSNIMILDFSYGLECDNFI